MDIYSDNKLLSANEVYPTYTLVILRMLYSSSLVTQPTQVLAQLQEMRLLAVAGAMIYSTCRGLREGLGAQALHSACQRIDWHPAWVPLSLALAN